MARGAMPIDPATGMRFRGRPKQGWHLIDGKWFTDHETASSAHPVNASAVEHSTSDVTADAEYSYGDLSRLFGVEPEEDDSLSFAAVPKRISRAAWFRTIEAGI